MSRSTRTLLFEKPSRSGRIIFRFHDTGGLSAFDSERPRPEPSNGKGLGGYLRVNNLLAIHELGKLDRLLEKLDELRVLKYPLIIDHSDPLHRQLMLDYLDDERDEPWVNFATLLAGVKETRGKTPYEELRALVKSNEHMIPKAIEYNALSSILRPDLGFLSRDMRGKRETPELYAMLQELNRRRTDPVYRLFFERFDNGLETMGMKESKIDKFPSDRHTGVFSRSSALLLTESEYSDFMELLNRASSENQRCQLDEECSRLLVHTIVGYGKKRALDLLMFIVQQRNRRQEESDYRYYSYYVSMRELAAYEGVELTSELLARAVADLDNPVEWALLLLV